MTGIIVPEHLRHTFYALVNYRTSIKNGVAETVGTKQPLQLNIDDINELVDLGIFQLRPHSKEPDTVVISAIRTMDAMENAFIATFTDNPFPTHPAFWTIGDWNTGTRVKYEELEGAVEGENHRIIDNGEDPVYTLKSIFTVCECLMNDYNEKLYLYPNDQVERFMARYKKGHRSGDTSATGSFMATLRCIIEHEVYSAGHLFVKRIDGKKGYDPCLDSYSLLAMLRWGLVIVERPYNLETREPELYSVTDLGKEFFEKAKPHLDKMTYIKRYNEIAEKMGWETI